MPKVHSKDDGNDTDLNFTPATEPITDPDMLKVIQTFIEAPKVPEPINLDLGRADLNALVDKLNEVIHYLKFKE